MELYNFYQLVKTTLFFSSMEAGLNVTISACVGAGLWLLFFILQGIGLCTMAKNRGVARSWLAFIPFANIYYMGKLVGECSLFGHKMKNAGLYAMIAQILAALVASAYILSECYLYVNHGAPQVDENYGTRFWVNLTGFSLGVSRFYEYSTYILLLVHLVAQLLMVVLLIGLYRKYAPGAYRGLALLSFFLPEARFIVVLVLRNRPAFDFEEYLRRQNEEYIRRRQEYYRTHGNPYSRGYGPYGSYQNDPYNRGYNQQQPPQQPPKPEEPFEEFSSQRGGSNGGKDGDDFFN